ncbi:hypothetical protein H2198_005173 [Neophaeococcomyces mojaviensis]|uniref:Uncharacterized protein n=1 Tax=Neophaeococcomyces mojaviensis TaxID=3383035 RepID=A0ACC3A6G2_9EURO|nr:hypothetical protein H2198_005173 [Knufia sp. JES_112]
MNAQSDENAAKRRKFRKGTHSCWQCRRRKVKCTFSSPEDATCISCHRQGTKCIRQGDLGEPETTKNNTGHTEQVAALNDQLVGEVSGNAQPKGRKAIDTCAPSTCFSSSLTPVSTLNDSSVIGWDLPDVSINQELVANGKQSGPTERSSNLLTTPELPPTPTSNHASIVEPTTHAEITQALLRTLPSRKDIETLLGKFIGCSTFCYQSNLKSRSVPPKDMLKEQISMANLLRPEGHPVLLARQMFLFVAALQHLSSNEVIPGLTERHHVITERLAESAIKMVTTNDVFLGTLDGLENIILEALYHTDGGNIRRAWITMRRAVTAAQLLGLHRPGHYRFKVVNSQNDLDPELMWTCIVYMESVLSLLLGLPTSTGGTNSTVQEPTSAAAQSCNLPTLIMSVTAKIIERNQIYVSQQALDITQDIDRELIKMAQNLPSTFWRPLALAGLEIDSVDAFWETRRAWDHMFYYTMVNQLHLPYMLSPSHALQRVSSRIACVNASREILTREIAIRTFNPNNACCRIGDFMALIAGMTLILAHVVSHCHKEMENPLVHQRLGDRAIVERALECMNSMSELHKDALASKCAALLKDLLAIEADAAQGHSYHTQNPQWTNGDHEDDRKVLFIKVPYIGVVRIARDGITSVAPMEIEQDRGPHEGVTIGGIGSIHVKSPRLSDHRPGGGTSGVAVPQAATTQSVEAPSIQQHVTQVVQVPSGDLFMRQDQMFPDAAASMDDWVFQGFDTAFFDVLMREVGDQPLNGTSAEGWDFGTNL